MTSNPGLASAIGGPTPGLNFLYAHLNRAIKEGRAVDRLHHPGPAHGGARALVANGRTSTATYSEVYSDITPGHRGAWRAAVPASSPSRGGNPFARWPPRRRAPSTRAAKLGLRGFPTAYGGPRFDNPDLLVAAGRGRRRARPRPERWLPVWQFETSSTNPRQRRCGAADPAPSMGTRIAKSELSLTAFPVDELRSLMIGLRPPTVLSSKPRRAAIPRTSPTITGGFATLLDEVSKRDSRTSRRGPRDRRPDPGRHGPMIVFSHAGKGWDRARTTSTARRPRDRWARRTPRFFRLPAPRGHPGTPTGARGTGWLLSGADRACSTRMAKVDPRIAELAARGARALRMSGQPPCETAACC